MVKKHLIISIGLVALLATGSQFILKSAHAQPNIMAASTPNGYGYTNGVFRLRASRQLSGRTGPIVYDGRVTVTTLHSGQRLKISVTKDMLHIGQETNQPPYLLPMASMPFDVASETVSFSKGLTTFKDKTGRSLTVVAYSTK